jgi:hypothetical protein
MKHVFVSYVRDNSADVDRLCAALNASGIKVWLDRSDISPGARWRQAIRNAIRGGEYFIACFSREFNARRKTYMNEELTLAIEELRLFPSSRVWFIPVLLSECQIPDRTIGAGETLRDINFVALYSDWNLGLRRIISVINPNPPDSTIDYLLKAYQRTRISPITSSCSPNSRCLTSSSSKLRGAGSS